ncbi:hypothetical protein [Hoylesella timonensis]|uniref:hypothetical protein n=1 Tax=Hoylesella timonensis TaxID=386414 RepID=UPI002889B56E|nr:hypothetical protein [Hoylesella timonensis]
MTRTELSSTVLENDNILISYIPYTFKDVLFIALMPMVIVTLTTLVELNIHNSMYSLLLLFFSIPSTFYLLLYMRDKKNKKIEGKIIMQHLDDIIEKDRRNVDNGVVELERSYMRFPINDSMTYGSRQLFIQLSNGKQMVYKVINPRMLDKVLIIEIDTHYEMVSNNSGD